MIGTFFNVSTILIGSLLGNYFKKSFADKYQEILMQAMGLAATCLGMQAVLQNLPKSKLPILFILSLAIGGVLGVKFDLATRFSNSVKKFSNSKSSEGLSTAILLYCMGTLSILGPVEAALHHNYTYLFTNGILDGITSIILASTFGLIIMLAALVLFFWQGSFYLIAFLLQSNVNPDFLHELSIVGGVLILSSGLSILGIKKFETMNLLPSLLVSGILFFILHYIGTI